MLKLGRINFYCKLQKFQSWDIWKYIARIRSWVCLRHTWTNTHIWVLFNICHIGQPAMTYVQKTDQEACILYSKAHQPCDMDWTTSQTNILASFYYLVAKTQYKKRPTYRSYHKSVYATISNSTVHAPPLRPIVITASQRLSKFWSLGKCYLGSLIDSFS